MSEDLEGLYEDYLKTPKFEIKYGKKQISLEDEVIEIMNNNALGDYQKADRIIELVQSYGNH